MVVLLSTTIISCSNALSLLNRLKGVDGLTSIQKQEIVQTIQQSVPSCPLIIKKDEPKRTPGT
jgi:hypothetical protein